MKFMFSRTPRPTPTSPSTSTSPAAQVEATGGVEVLGDAAAARSILDNMNFMF